MDHSLPCTDLRLSGVALVLASGGPLFFAASHAFGWFLTDRQVRIWDAMGRTLQGVIATVSRRLSVDCVLRNSKSHRSGLLSMCLSFREDFACCELAITNRYGHRYAGTVAER